MTIRLHRTPRTLLATLALGALALPALAQNTLTDAQSHTYIGLQVGRHNLDSWDNRLKLGAGVELDGRVDTDAGNVYGLTLGRQRHDGQVRYELEYQRGSFDVQRLQAGVLTQAVSGSGKYQALTLNAYRQQAWNESWSGYAGLGLGWGRAELPSACVPGCVAGAASKSGLALLARAGAEYRLDAHQNLFAQYTLLRVQGPTAGSTPGVSYDNQWIGALAVGYRHVF